MKYCSEYYAEPFLLAARILLYNMISVQFAFGVIFTGIFAVKMLQVFGVQQPIVDAVFIPCGFYFVWALLISIVDYSIEGDVL